MTDHADPQHDETTASGDLTAGTEQLVIDDLLLALFDPTSGSIRGEGILFYVLGGAAVADLGRAEAITVEDKGMRGNVVSVVEGAQPSDPLLASVWARIEPKPRGVQVVLADAGPHLRPLVIDRLVERGYLRREEGKILGLFPSSTLVAADMTRRDELVEQMRAALVDGVDPDERIATIIALVSASRTLPQFNAEIPWSGTVATRARQFEKGDFAGGASAQAVTRTMNAIIVNSIVGAGIAAGVIAAN